MPSTARVSFWTTRHPPRWSTLTATGAPPCGGSAVTMHPLVPPWRRWRRPSTSTSRRRAGSRARGRTIGGRGGWSSHGRWRARRCTTSCPCRWTRSRRCRGTWFALQSRARRSSWCGSASRSVRPTSTRRGSRCWARFAVGRWLLAWRPTALAAHRARLLTAVATLACMRVNEVARLQVCDLWFDYLASYGIPSFEGTCSVHIDRRKNDTVRKGHYPALGRSKDPSLDIVAQLRTWLRVAGLAVHRACAKRARPAARCQVCPPLFPRTRCAQGGVTVSRIDRAPVSRQATGSAGPSCRRGVTPRASRASPRGGAASLRPLRRGWTRRFCTCRAGTVKLFPPARTCTSRRPTASS
jgi:hypothetical protein